MSIYATLWRLKFPRYGDDHTGCDWVEVQPSAPVGTTRFDQQPGPRWKS
jgi:hypothetical protein